MAKIIANYNRTFSFNGVEIIIQSMRGTKPINQDRGFAFHLPVTHNLKTTFNKKIALKEKDKIVKQALEKAIKALSKGLDEEAYSNGAGATLTVCAACRIGNVIKLFTGQIGDSAAYCFTRNKVKLLTPAHKPSVPAEAKHIYQVGGRIYNNYVLLGMMGLAMTRSLGNKQFREVGVIDNPDINEYKITSGEILVCSDGFLDSFNDQEIASVLKEHTKDLSKLAVLSCSGQFYRDDITTVLTKNIVELPPDSILVFGVSDGNGDLGHEVSNYVAKNIKKIFITNFYPDNPIYKK